MSTCDVYSTSIFTGATYDGSVSAQYCAGAVTSGAIDLDSITGETMELTSTGSTAANQNIWEWVITTNINKTVSLIIDRSFINYEEIKIEYTKESGDIVTTANSDLFNCGGTSTTLNYTDIKVKELKVRAEIGSDSSSYSILIQQVGIDYGTPKALTSNK